MPSKTTGTAASRRVELLLTSAVPHLGQPGDVVHVKSGYARNYLLPMGLAAKPSPHTLRLLQKHKKKLEELAAQKAANLKALADALARHSVSIEANANEEGHLYGSVSAPDIAKALRQAEFAVEDDQVKISGPLKELGLYTVHVQLSPELTTEIKVWVVPAHAS